MKKQILVTLGVAVLGLTSYSVTYMQIVTQKGEKVYYSVDDVSEVNFVDNIDIPADTVPENPVDTMVSDHDYIDLGLPSGTLWATYNIGASKPDEIGDYFAWGETMPKKVYNAKTYKYGNAKLGKYDMWELDSLTKYNFGNEHPGEIDSLSTLLPEDDAATANWGSEWRMPTVEEFRELAKNCYVVLTDTYNDSVPGAIFYKAKRDNDKGQFIRKNETPYNYSVKDPHIFLPAANRICDTVKYTNFNGIYLSSSLYTNQENCALSIEYDSYASCFFYNGQYRYYGYSVRAVKTQKEERKVYNVSFYTDDSVLIGTRKVDEFSSAKELRAPDKEGYVFYEWSTPFDYVTSDLSVYAVYKSIVMEDNHPYVDLGLPSGTLWSTYNLGATKPEEYGDYYSWGEIQTKGYYYWETYKYAKAKEQWTIYDLTKYNFGNMFTTSIDSLSTLFPEDDATKLTWGSNWRMPTKDEIKELVDNCEYKWTEVEGVYGAEFTGENGNSIFLPAGGNCSGISYRPSYDGKFGYYWSSSLVDSVDISSYSLSFNENKVDGEYTDLRYHGFTIRPVRTNKAEHIFYDVNFYTSDSILIETQKVESGKSAVEVKAPAKKGYDFVGWSASFDKITSDLSVYAIYKEFAPNHTYVDLGLPSGTLWATYNVGATDAKEAGDYFAWGETEPKDNYDWSTYKWATTKLNEKTNTLELDSLTKYTSNSETKNPYKSTLNLLPEDDAAAANWGSEWRMPTIEELNELLNYCRFTRMDDGVLFTGKNYNTIFFPYAGCNTNRGLLNVREAGRYWTSTYDSIYADLFRLSSYAVEDYYDDNRSDGFSVRAVLVKKAEHKYYNVNFYTEDSVLIESQNVMEGTPAKEVKAPEKAGYAFVEWSSPFEIVNSDLSLYPVYEDSATMSEHRYVDLGLPSGTLWATSDIETTGSFSDLAYFAWGETEPKEEFFDDSYKWYDENRNMIKYNPAVDTLKTLLPEDDAATVNWGEEWRMPTKDEYWELIENCKFVKNGYGAKFIGPNGRSIRFSASGQRVGNRFYFNDKYGLFWTSSLDDTSKNYAYYMIFMEQKAGVPNGDVTQGLPVRPVRVKK